VTIVDDTRDTPATPELSDADARALAREAWHASGGTLTGKQLAERFGRSAKWGQNQRAAAEQEAAGRAAGGASPTVPRHTPAARPPVSPRAAPERPTVPRPAPPARTAARPARGKPAGSVAVRRVTVLAVTIVSLVAFAASYSHMFHLALEAGEGELVARALPLSVDGLVLAATMALLSARGAGRDSGALPWLALLLGLGASLAANVAAAEPTPVGRLVAAWPPVALALSFELLLRQTRGEGTR